MILLLKLGRGWFKYTEPSNGHRLGLSKHVNVSSEDKINLGYMFVLGSTLHVLFFLRKPAVCVS
jgi:hypothetical protein